MNYEETAALAVKPTLKPFDAFTHWGASLNGYVVVPDNFPLDYYDKIYDEIDQSPFGGLTFGGYFTEVNSELVLLYLDAWPTYDPKNFKQSDLKAIEDLKKVSVRAIGFDNHHIHENEMSAEEGAEYLSKQLKKLNF